MKTSKIDSLVTRIRRQPALRAGEWDSLDLATYMAQENIPGASWAMIDGGELAWARGYGLQRAGCPAPVDTETRFQAASISKPLAALTALSLVQQGRLDLDEDVRRYLASWALPANAGWQPRVSLRQLLSHSAGVTVEGFPGYAADAELPALLQVLNGARPANTPPVMVDSLPGLQYRYSGGGYAIVQQVIADVTGQPFWQAAKERVLDPVGMFHSTYRCPLPEDERGRAAVGHRADGEPIAGGWHHYPESAAAGLWTTPSDLALLILQIERSRRGEAGAVFSPKMIAEMLTPQVRVPEMSTGWMGLGLFLSGAGDERYFGHGGSNEGYRCQMIALQGKGQAAVIMTNADSGWILKEEWMNTIALEFGWDGYASRPPAVTGLEPSALEGCAGSYRLGSGALLRVSVTAAGLALEYPGQPPIPLFPQSTDRFFAKAVNIELRFRPAGLVLRQNGVDLEAEIITP